MKQRTLALVLVMLSTLIAGNVAFAKFIGGSCKNGSWEIDDNGKLTVNIYGEMADYGKGKAPWYKYRSDIKAIHLGSGCTNVGRFAFCDLYNVEEVTGGENVEACAMFSFYECGESSKRTIPQIYFPKCSYVGEYAFGATNCEFLSLPLVETYKANSVYSLNFADLGSTVKTLRPATFDYVDYVFIQNPTPPDWERLLTINERMTWDIYMEGSSTTAAFLNSYDEKYHYPLFRATVIVPQEYLQTYIDYYPSKHPEVPKGYMSTNKENDIGTGKLVAGAPIYRDGHFLGGWYVKGSVLHVCFPGEEIPTFITADCPWKEVQGKVTSMHLHVSGDYCKLSDDVFNADVNNLLQGIKYLDIEAKSIQVGNRAFKNCTDLETVEFNKDLHYHIPEIQLNLGREAFYGCKNLTRIGERTTFIKLGVSCFEGCEELDISENDFWVFKGDEDHLSIPQRAFYDCKNIQWSKILKDVETIEKQAFYGARVGYVTLTNVKTIGEEAFAGSTINSLKVDDWSDCEIGSRAFANCKVKDFTLSSKYKTMSDDAFDGTDISSVILQTSPDLYSEEYAGSPIWGAMVYVPESFPIIGNYWEISATGLLTIEENSGSSETSPPWSIYNRYITQVNIESGVKKIEAGWFSDLEYLERVNIPYSCKTIEDNAFKNCVRLKEINISQVEVLGDYVFKGCSSLEYIDLGRKLQKAGDYIFMDCKNLQLIDNKENTPAEVTLYTFAEIGSGAYEARSAFRGVTSGSSNGQAAVTLNVPDEFVTNYIIDPNWGKFHIKFADSRGTWEHAGPFGDGTWILYDDSTMVIVADKGPDDFSWKSLRFTDEVAKKTKRVEFTGNVSSLGVIFDLFPNIESVSLTPSIKTLDGTFNYCEKLKEINLDDVETIGESTFTHCALTEVDLSNVKSIGKDAFYGCEKLLFATLGSQCTVGTSVFSHCSSLVAVNLGGADLDNANGCFNSCKNLLSVVYNGQNLPSNIFANCTALTEVKLGSRVRSIQWTAFDGCTALDSIYCDSPMPPLLPTGKTQDIIGYEGSGDVQIPIFGPEYEVWAFNGLDKANIKLFVHPDCVPVYGRIDIWKEMDIQGNSEDVEPLLPTGGSLRGCGKDENGENVISGSTWYLDEEGKMTFDALGNIAARTSDNNYWWSEFDSYLPFIATVEVTDDVTGVPNNMFGWLDGERLTRGVTTVILGEGLKKAGYDSFHFSGIKDVYIYSEDILDLHGNTFDRDAAEANDATLHVLKDPEDKYLNYYRQDNATSRFPNIVADLDPRHPKVQAVRFDYSEVTMHPGDTLQLEPRFTPENVEDKTLRYMDASEGYHVSIDENGQVIAMTEGVAYVEAFSSYTLSGNEVMALWGPSEEIYLKITVAAPEPGEEIFYDYKEGDDGLTITYHQLDHKEHTCEVAGRYDEDDMTTLAVPENTIGIINIPKIAGGNTVVRIGANAFYELEGITEVRLPATVTQIGRYAFASCYNVKDVYIPVSQPLQYTDAYGDVMEESMGHNDAFYRVGEDVESGATLHVPAGSRTAWNIYPWNEWFRMIVDDIKMTSRGDANGDGNVDMDDATFVTNIILGTEEATEAADVNNDGVVSMPDIMFIMNKIQKGKFPDEK